MLSFFLKAFLLSFTAIAFSWLVEGAFYTYYYASGQEHQGASGITLPQPAVVEALVKDTNFLLLGISGKPYPAQFLTDTIIVGQLKVNPAQLMLTSIPRDVMVKTPGGNSIVKINSLYELGQRFSPLEPEHFIKQKIEEITGLTIDYYAVIDVAGLEKIVDALGGVDVTLDKALYDPTFPGPNYSYEPLYLSAGAHYLNGHDAVRFARSRHSTRGDFDRVIRQQLLLGLLKEKALAQGLSAKEALGLYESVKDHLTSNLGIKDIPFLLANLLNFKGGAIQSNTIDNGPSGLLRSSHASTGAYMLLPKNGLEHYEDIQEFFNSLKTEN